MFPRICILLPEPKTLAPRDENLLLLKIRLILEENQREKRANFTIAGTRKMVQKLPKIAGTQLVDFNADGASFALFSWIRHRAKNLLSEYETMVLETLRERAFETFYYCSPISEKFREHAPWQHIKKFKNFPDCVPENLVPADFDSAKIRQKILENLPEKSRGNANFLVAFTQPEFAGTLENALKNLAGTQAILAGTDFDSLPILTACDLHVIFAGTHFRAGTDFALKIALACAAATLVVFENPPKEKSDLPPPFAVCGNANLAEKIQFFMENPLAGTILRERAKAFLKMQSRERENRGNEKSENSR